MSIRKTLNAIIPDELTSIVIRYNDITPLLVQKKTELRGLEISYTLFGETHPYRVDGLELTDNMSIVRHRRLYNSLRPNETIRRDYNLVMDTLVFYCKIDTRCKELASQIFSNFDDVEW